MGLRVLGEQLDERPGLLDALEGLGGERHPRTVTGDGHDLVDGHGADAHPYALHTVIQLPRLKPAPPPHLAGCLGSETYRNRRLRAHSTPRPPAETRR